jgi:hypothetical protein
MHGQNNGGGPIYILIGEISNDDKSDNISGKRTLLSEPLSYRYMNVVCNCERLPCRNVGGDS